MKGLVKNRPVEKLRTVPYHNYCGVRRRSTQVVVGNEEKEHDEETKLPERTGENRA
jgi:hypothetical protein